MKLDDEESIYYYLSELENDILSEIINDMESNRLNPNHRQPWKVIPAKMLIKEWEYNQKTGLTHDKAIEKIESIVIENYIKLYINTVLGGHSEMGAYEFAEHVLSEDMSRDEFEKLLEDTDDYICDENGAWRLSDYALKPMFNFVVQILQTNDSNKKLYLIDCILNIIHQRSDLSSWFVEGGRRTLSQLSGEMTPR